MRISDWSSDVCSSDLYLSLGDEKYLTAVTNAFRMIQEQSWASGGWGPGEFFIKPGSGELAETLFRNFKSSFETVCGSYAHFKLTRYLLRITRDSRYGDSMERVFYKDRKSTRLNSSH